MGWRFRRSMNFGPLRLNLGKRGLGYSVGRPGARIGHSSTGRRYASLGLPGTGLSWFKSWGSKRKAGSPVAPATPPAGPTRGTGRPLPPPPAAPAVSQTGSSPTTSTGSTGTVAGVPWWEQPHIKDF